MCSTDSYNFSQDLEHRNGFIWEVLHPERRVLHQQGVFIWTQLLVWSPPVHIRKDAYLHFLKGVSAAMRNPAYLHSSEASFSLASSTSFACNKYCTFSTSVLQHWRTASGKCLTHQTGSCVLKSSLNVKRNTCEWTYKQLHRLHWVYRHISKTVTSPEAQRKGTAGPWEEGSPISPHLHMTTCASNTLMESFLHWSQLPSQGMIFINFMNNALCL